MSMQRNLSIVWAALVLGAAASGASAITLTLFSDDFSGAGVLNGTAPDATTGGATWVATSTFGADGAIGGAGAGTATLAFTPEDGGVYTLDGSFTGLTNDPASQDWVGLAFATGQSTSATKGGANDNRFISNQTVGLAWMMFRGDGATGTNTAFLGDLSVATNPGIVDGAAYAGWPAAPTGVGGDVDMRIILDTTAGAGAWTATWYAKRPADANYTEVRAATTLLDANITSIGFGKSFTNLTGMAQSFSLTAVLPGDELQSAASGLWGSAATWDPNQVPTAVDFVTVGAGHQVEVAGAADTGRWLTVDGGSSKVTVGSGAALSVQSAQATGGGAIDVAGSMTSSGSVSVDASSILSVTGTLITAELNTSGIVTIDPAADATGVGAINVTGGTLTAGGTTGSLALSGTGTLRLDGSDLTVAGLSASGGTAVIENGGAADAVLTVNGTGSVSGVLQDGAAGTLGLTKDGGGTLTLSSANTFTGPTAVAGGTLAINNSSALGATSSLSLAGGTALRPTIDGLVIGLPITLGDIGTTATIQASSVYLSGGVVSTVTLNGAISGGGNLTFLGTSGGNTYGTIILGAASDYAGSTLLTTTGGNENIFVKLGIDNALPTTTVLTLDGQFGAGSGRSCDLDLNGYNQTLAGLTNVTRSSRSQRVKNTSASPSTLTISNDSDYTFSGFLGAGGTNFGLTKKGGGMLTLSGTNTYKGDTIVEGGVLSIGTAYLNDAADVYLATGAVLELTFAGTDTIDELFIDGIGQYDGTWGAVGSGADYESALLEGTGLLYVTTPGILPGDANGDGVVNAADYIMIKRNMGNTGGIAYQDGDVTGDGDVDWADLGVLSTAMNTGAAGGQAVTPEPGSALLLLLGAGWLIRRRK